MPERVVIHQKNNFETDFRALDPHKPDSTELRPVEHIGDLTPYGTLLAGLGSCTAIVVHTYAQYHGIDLREVEVSVEYQRGFEEDCEHCEDIDKYEEQINMSVSFRGNLSPQENEKLFKISKQCPIHKMLKSGIEVISQLRGNFEKV